MSNYDVRYAKLLEVLPKHKSAEKALIEAGFSPITARTQAKRVLKNLVEYQSRKLVEMSKDSHISSRRLMSEIVGIEEKDMFKRLRWMAMENDKDVGVGYKILSGLAKQHGVDLSPEEGEHKAPSVLNVIVEKKEMIDGNVPKSELENGLTKP